MKKWIKISLVASMALSGWVYAEVQNINGVTIYDIPESSQQTAEAMKIPTRVIPRVKNADPKDVLPSIDPEKLKESLLSRQAKPFVKKVISEGRAGSEGDEFATSLPEVTVQKNIEEGGELFEYGENLSEDFPAFPYTTSRVDMYAKLNKTAFSKKYPYSAAGKLFFKIGGDSYVCTASMIKRGVLVTAAHCVSEFGKNQIFKDFQYVPAYKKQNAPYGVWSAKKVLVLSNYLKGKDGECLVPSSATVCLDDVALIILKPKKGKYAGDLTGWFRVGLTGYSYVENAAAQMTSLGYPVSHDLGKLMQRNDSIGALLDDRVNYNTVIGSRMTGGSSGGPWLVNFGETAKLSNGVSVGNDAKTNVVVGVTSWGFVDDSLKYQFASPFTNKNIGKLLKTACRIDKKACR